MAYKRLVVNPRRRRKAAKKKIANKSTKASRSKAAKKAARTRNAKKVARSKAAKKGVATRKRNAKKTTRKATKKATKKRNKRKTTKKPSAAQLRARRNFAAKYGGKKTAKKRNKKKATKKRNPATAATYAAARAGGKRMARAPVGGGGRVVPAGGVIARKLGKELADVKRLLDESMDRCRKTEKALKSDLGAAKRSLKSARGQLTKANNKIKALNNKVDQMRGDQAKALRAAGRRAVTIGKETKRLGKLVQYYNTRDADGKRVRRKRSGGKSLLGSKTRKRHCPPKKKSVKRSARGVRAGIESGAATGGTGSSMAYKRWCSGVKRNFWNMKEDLQ